MEELRKNFSELVIFIVLKGHFVFLPEFLHLRRILLKIDRVLYQTENTIDIKLNTSRPKKTRNRRGAI